METSLTYCDSAEAYFSSDEKKWINRIRKLNKEHPYEVRILKQPEENDSCIYCIIPAKYLKIGPKKRMNYTEEEMKQKMELLNEARAKKAREKNT